MRAQLGRFGLAGIANTLVGYGVIIAGILVGLGDYVANALGYAAGLIVSFILNRRFTFRIRGAVERAEVVRFLVAVGIAYLGNLAVLTICRDLLVPDNPIAHLPAIATYTALFYILSARFVFGGRRSV